MAMLLFLIGAGILAADQLHPGLGERLARANDASFIAGLVCIAGAFVASEVAQARRKIVAQLKELRDEIRRDRGRDRRE